MRWRTSEWNAGPNTRAPKHKRLLCARTAYAVAREPQTRCCASHNTAYATAQDGPAELFANAPLAPPAPNARGAGASSATPRASGCRHRCRCCAVPREPSPRNSKRNSRTITTPLAAFAPPTTGGRRSATLAPGGARKRGCVARCFGGVPPKLICETRVGRRRLPRRGIPALTPPAYRWGRLRRLQDAPQRGTHNPALPLPARPVDPCLYSQTTCSYPPCADRPPPPGGGAENAAQAPRPPATAASP